jgi:hypothetical protein
MRRNGKLTFEAVRRSRRASTRHPVERMTVSTLLPGQAVEVRFGAFATFCGSFRFSVVETTRNRSYLVANQAQE